jgi:hypothetical protein
MISMNRIQPGAPVVCSEDGQFGEQAMKERSTSPELQ